jgi:DNA modification methylase
LVDQPAIAEAREGVKKERLNELDGKTWEKYSISVWDIVKTPDEMKLKHPAMFPVELCRRLIQIYTKKRRPRDRPIRRQRQHNGRM